MTESDDDGEPDVSSLPGWVLQSTGYALVALGHDKEGNTLEATFWMGRAMGTAMRQVVKQSGQIPCPECDQPKPKYLPCPECGYEPYTDDDS